MNLFKSKLLRHSEYRILRYLSAIVLSGLGYAVISFFEKYEGIYLFSFAVLPIVVSAVIGGTGPAFLASVVSALLIDYYLVAPIHQVFDSLASYVRIVNLFLIASVVSYLINKVKAQYALLEEQQRDLITANTQKDGILAMVAHDIRNPVSIIVGYTEMMYAEDFGSISAEIKEALDHIKASSGLVLTLVEDLVCFSALQNNLRMNTNQLNLTTTIRQEVDRMAFIAGRKNIVIENNLDCTELSFRGDEVRIRQIVHNLVGNAIKFSSQFTKINVNLEDAGEHLLLSISDGGPGIPEHELPKLFVPFQKLTNRPTGGETSSGLGLSIVKAIVEGHGCSIVVDSQVGIGTTFKILFPKLTHLPIDVQKIYEKSEPVFNSFDSGRLDSRPTVLYGKILVIEDDVIVRKIMARFLTKIGVDFVLVENGKLGLEEVKWKEFDLVFMDFEMPVLTGIETTVQIRSLVGNKAGIPIIGMTSHTSENEVKKGLDAGVNQVLTKPVSIDDVRKVVAKFVRQSRATSDRAV